MAFELILLFLLLMAGVAIPLFAILKAWVVDQTMGAGAALSSLLALFVLAGFTWSHQGTGWMFAGLGAMVVGCAALPVLATQTNRHTVNRLRDEDILKFQRAISHDPNNAGARALLAGKYMEIGRYHDAAYQFGKAAELLPNSSQASQWRRRHQDALDKEAGHDKYQFSVCTSCRADLPAGSKVCAHCGAVQHMGFVEWSLRPENLSVIIRDTVVVMVVLICLLAVFSALPLEVKGCVLCSSAVVGAYYLLKGVGG